MKKAVCGIFLCLSLAIFAFSGGFSIKLNGGATYLMGGDYNKVIDGINADWQSSIWTVGSELEKVTMAWNFGAEFIYNITDQIGLGLGAGYIMASSDSTMDLTWGPLTQSYTYKPSLSAIPITLNFHFSLPVGDMMNIHLFAGPGLYISSFKFDERWQIPLLLTDVTGVFEPDGVMAFGAQGGLGLEFAFGSNIALCIDVMGRMASMSGLTGDYDLSGMILGISGSITNTGQTLYYFEEGGYSHFAIQNSLPAGSGVSNAREGSISLSGVAGSIGLKITI